MSFFTYEWNPVWRRRQYIVQDKLHHGDGEQHSDLEAELLATAVWDHEGGQVQTHEEQDGQHEVDDVEASSPLDGDLCNDEVTVNEVLQVKGQQAGSG